MQPDKLIQKLDKLQALRVNHEENWQAITSVFHPTRANINIERSKGDKASWLRLAESTPVLANQTFSNILNSIFTNPSSVWSKLTIPNKEISENDEVQRWLEEANRIMFDKMYDNKSNLETALNKAYQDASTIGTWAIHVRRGKDSLLHYSTLDIKNYYIDENDENKVDYVALKMKMTAKQIVDRWGNDEDANIDSNITRDANDVQKQDKEYNLQLHIYKRNKRDPEKFLDPLNKKYAIVYVDVKHKSTIKESGADFFPIAVGRSELVTGEIYGTPRALLALADARQINRMANDITYASELLVRPPMVINPGGNFTKPLNLSPGSVNKIANASLLTGNRPVVETLILPRDIPIGIEMLERKALSIQRVFFLDKLEVISDPRATATQILEKKAESLRLLGSIGVSVQHFLDQIISNTFDILFEESFDINRNRLEGAVFPELPDALISNNDIEIKAEFLNAVNQSQRLNELNSMDILLQNTIELSQIDPNILDIVNLDNIVREKARLLSVNPDIIRSEEEVEQIRELKLQEAQRQQELAETQQEAEVINKISS